MMHAPLPVFSGHPLGHTGQTLFEMQHSMHNIGQPPAPLLLTNAQWEGHFDYLQNKSSNGFKLSRKERKQSELDAISELKGPPKSTKHTTAARDAAIRQTWSSACGDCGQVRKTPSWPRSWANFSLL